MTRGDILAQANKQISGQREQDYGSPENNFKKIARFWNAYLGFENDAITSEDVANMMTLLKVARASSGNYHLDNYIDIAGYAACAGEISYKENNTCPYDPEGASE